LKLDFEKAYNKVHWSFLLHCLRVRGFSETWCLWIENVLYNGAVSVKLNGITGPYFESYKGVRQGDPLLSLLFSFAADCSTRMVVKVTIPQIFTRARGPLAASAHEVGTTQVRVLIGCVFVEIVTESETCHICSAVLLTI
jgi:hypothetical protein